MYAYFDWILSYNIELDGFLVWCRDPEIYPNPQEFRPERFSADEKNRRHKAAFLGFGETPRMCFGYNLAVNQTKVALAQIVNFFSKRWHLDSIRNNDKFSIVFLYNHET